MPDQTPQNAPYGHDGTDPAPTGPMTGTAAAHCIGRWEPNSPEWDAARAGYGDSASIALDKIRARLDQYTDMYGGRNSIVPGGVVSDLYAILDTTKEHHA